MKLRVGQTLTNGSKNGPTAPRTGLECPHDEAACGCGGFHPFRRPPLRRVRPTRQAEEERYSYEAFSMFQPKPHIYMYIIYVHNLYFIYREAAGRNRWPLVSTCGESWMKKDFLLLTGCRLRASCFWDQGSGLLLSTERETLSLPSATRRS